MTINILILLVCCTTKTNTAKITSTDTPNSEISTRTEPPDSNTTDTKPPFVGSWSSDSCGDRAYERRITFHSDRRVTVQDLISPCPPKKTCAWSGIATGSGVWRLEENSIHLSFTKMEPSQAYGETFPVHFQWEEPTTLRVVSEQHCNYTPLVETPKNKSVPR